MTQITQFSKKVTKLRRHITVCKKVVDIYLLTNVYGHITLKIPVLVRSLKSSNVEPG